MNFQKRKNYSNFATVKLGNRADIKTINFVEGKKQSTELQTESSKFVYILVLRKWFIKVNSGRSEHGQDPTQNGEVLVTVVNLKF